MQLDLQPNTNIIHHSDFVIYYPCCIFANGATGAKKLVSSKSERPVCAVIVSEFYVTLVNKTKIEYRLKYFLHTLVDGCSLLRLTRQGLVILL